MPVSWTDRLGSWAASALSNGADPMSWFDRYGVKVATTNEWYVSPNGLAGNTGSISSPWDLQTALNHPAVVKPGDVIWIRGGTYVGTFTINLIGTPARPIIVRQYPLERATISGNVVSITGQYVWFWGPEVVSPTPTLTTTNGVQSRSTGSRYINLVIHDAAGVGLTLFDDLGGTGAKPDQEAYGCISYNNGNTVAPNTWAHGFYINNVAGYRRVRDCIAFNNTSFGIQSFGSVDDIHNMLFEGNIAFGNGSTSAPPFITSPSDMLIGGLVIAQGVQVKSNYIYRSKVGLGNALQLGYYFSDQINRGGVVRGNYIYGLVEAFDFADMFFQDNTIYSLSTDYFAGSGGLLAFRGNLSGWLVDGNVLYGLSQISKQFGYGPTTPPAPTAYTFAQWLAATGINPSPAALRFGTTPINKIVVRPNAYEKGRGHVAIFNWSGAANVPVDLSNVLQPGDQYAIYNIENLFGTPVLQGTYAGGSINFPMSAVVPPAPVGRGTAPAASGPTFQVFVVTLYPTRTEIGFDFRDTAAFVSDPANCTYALGIEAGNSVLGPYPQQRLGYTFGWDSGPDIASRDRDAAIDHRLSGTNFVVNGAASQATFRVDLPASGNYTIHLAVGDQSFGGAFRYCQVLDDQAPVITIDTGAVVLAATHFIDASGVERTSAANWVANEVGVSVAFRSKVLRIKIGHPVDVTSNSPIAHIRIVPT